MYEFASVVGLVGVIAFLAVLSELPQIRYLGGFVLLPVILVMFLAGTVLYAQGASRSCRRCSRTGWPSTSPLVSIAEGSLMTSAVLTVLFLVKQRYDRRGRRAGLPTPGRSARSGARLPGRPTLDKAAYRIVAFRVPALHRRRSSAARSGPRRPGAATGAGTRRRPGRSSSWVIYACYLHARATAGWKGRAAAWINLLGFGAITFNFLVVNIVISGLHSYAGLN